MKTERRPKSKFGNLNFDSVETLSREELKKVKGGYGTDTGPIGYTGPITYNILCGCDVPDGIYYVGVTWHLGGVSYEGCCSLQNAKAVCIQNTDGRNCLAGSYAASTC